MTDRSAREEAAKNALAITEQEGGGPSDYCRDQLALFVAGEISVREMADRVVANAILIDGNVAPAAPEYFTIVVSPEMVAMSDTWREFDGRDRRRIKRELRKALQRVRAGTYKFAELPADAPVYEI